MPTGYTAPIKDGITFSDFALMCARAFGACIDIRENPLSSDIPVFEPSTWHKDACSEARSRIELLEEMDADDCEAAAESKYRCDMSKYERAVDDNIALSDRYNGMLRQVESWAPPTEEHEGLKRFMENQLGESMRFDCGIEHLEQPRRLGGQEWLNGELERARRDIVYHSAEWQKEQDRVAQRNRWVRELKNSLPGAAAQQKEKK